MHRTTWVEFNRCALRHNAKTVRRLAPNAAILAMVKANGYGHGADWVAEHLNDIVDGFAVARLNEAMLLRKQLSDKRIVLLGTEHDAISLNECALHQLDVVIHDLQTATLLASIKLPQAITVWLKLNTGMNRLGMSEPEFIDAHQLLKQSPNVATLHHMSHFSDAETTDKTRSIEQYQCLHTLSHSLGETPISMANSAAIISFPQSHLNWVRPGIMLYGDDPTNTLNEGDLQAAMTFKAKVLAVRDLAAGDGVGYNRRWQSASTSRIATVAAGYADGYPRQAPDGTPVLINGKRAALAGRVSMDLLTVDVTGLEINAGDTATLWGDNLSAAEVAQHCGTISYELFTRITQRVERVY
ncbi:Alanine racemase, biosynthetic [Zhongshania aliphaticivorans]|uniref:Alanine racemase n=1 Tax=Zhongshania aliphaticivorans TaxID=1470434 RepID=A0A5S9NF50_9GAMM|nr:alanine racemase [Zhongshania aliphaticivorans]CAA0088656.1 Alanine racemase, biosynthetic [Zhongshania aliphaticivorans]CAA0094855.1 Alanine racemase, biosynthetic [Zhongshania aliphaticivorans]